MAQRRHGAEYDEDEELVGRRGWRLGIWAAVAAVALTSAGVAAYTDVGAHQQNRTATARADQGHPLGTELEARRLSEAVRLLAADRDRLALRVNALERNLGDMTGSITPGGNRLAASPGPYAASPVLGRAARVARSRTAIRRHAASQSGAAVSVCCTLTMASSPVATRTRVVAP